MTQEELLEPEHGSQIVHRFFASYGETDQSGIVHHAVYLNWLEDARTALWRGRMPFAQIEREQRITMAVTTANLRFRRPARFDDDIAVECWVQRIQGARITTRYRVWRQKPEPEELLVEAEVVLACIDLNRMRPVRVPEDVLKHCDPFEK